MYLLLILMAWPHLSFTFEKLAQPSNSTINFDPESATFSKMGNLKTWVAQEHQMDPAFMKTLQSFIAMQVAENPSSLALCYKDIENNDGDERYFGKSFPTYATPVMDFLQFVHKISDQGSVNVLEIAAARGWVSWMIPFAFQQSSRLYVNELSAEMLKQFEELCDERFKGK